MPSLPSIYADCIEAAIARTDGEDLDVGPLGEAKRQALTARYDLDDAVASTLFDRYPAAGIRPPDCNGRLASYEGTTLLPSVDWLVTMKDEDDKWPRAWFPLSVTGDHQIQFLIRGSEGVFSLYNNDFAGDTPYDRGPRIYASLPAFLQAATATLRHLRPEAFAPEKVGRWFFRKDVDRLRQDVLAAIRADSCREDEGPLLLPQTGVVVPGSPR